MPQSGNALDLMAPLLRRKNLIAKLAQQLGQYNQQRGTTGPVGQASRAGLGAPSALQSVPAMGAALPRALNSASAHSLMPERLPQIDLSNIPSGFVTPQLPPQVVGPPTGFDGGQPADAPADAAPADAPAEAAPAEAPAEAPASSVAAAPEWQTGGFVSEAAMNAFNALDEGMQMRIMNNPAARRRYFGS